ncbi:MAG: hypothetical protein FWG02_10750 [Holophagaceae bacterium]|nr:hypothetical protein [Holophagaceae bacterium]
MDNRQANEWISVKDAATMMGYSAPYFRELFCQTECPLVKIRVKTFSNGRRRILVSKHGVLELIKSEMLEPV